MTRRRSCSARESALPARRMDLPEGRIRLRQDLADQGDQRAVALWPRHHRLSRRGRRSFYAAQEVKLPQVSLKQLVCLPGTSEDDHGDAQVASALHKAGLGDFIEHLADENREGKSWDQVLSGGQKQKLVRGPHPPAAAGPAVPRRGDRRARPRRQDRLPSGDQGQLPRRHRDQRHARGGGAASRPAAPSSTTACVTIADGVATKKPLAPDAAGRAHHDPRPAQAVRGQAGCAFRAG